MPDITIPPQIANIIERLHTQDNRITANPLFAVQQKRRIYGLGADYRDGTVFVDDEGIEFDERESLENGCCEVGYRDTWEFVTGCMTEQGCKDYIACNGHNLKEPRIYAYGSYRNAEFIAVREWLMSLRPIAGVEGRVTLTPEGEAVVPGIGVEFAMQCLARADALLQGIADQDVTVNSAAHELHHALEVLRRAHRVEGRKP